MARANGERDASAIIATQQRREGLLFSSKRGFKAKGSKQGGPFSFEIQNTGPAKNGNQVNPRIELQSIPASPRGRPMLDN